jgi:hypothetical protein
LSGDLDFDLAFESERRAFSLKDLGNEVENSGIKSSFNPDDFKELKFSD